MKTKIFFVYILAVVNALGYVDHIHVSKTRDQRTAISSRFQILMVRGPLRSGFSNIWLGPNFRSLGPLVRLFSAEMVELPLVTVVHDRKFKILGSKSNEKIFATNPDLFRNL